MAKQLTQEERLDFLIEAFKTESEDYRNLDTPKDTENKKKLLRSLMNVRMPKDLPQEVLRIQDDYLKECAEEKGIVELSAIPEIITNSPPPFPC